MPPTRSPSPSRQTTRSLKTGVENYDIDVLDRELARRRQPGHAPGVDDSLAMRWTILLLGEGNERRSENRTHASEPPLGGRAAAFTPIGRRGNGIHSLTHGSVLAPSNVDGVRMSYPSWQKGPEEEASGSAFRAGRRLSSLLEPARGRSPERS